MSDIERKLLSLMILDPANTEKVHKVGLKQDVFEQPVYESMFVIMIDHWEKYQKPPTQYQIETELPGYPLDEVVEEPVEWVVQKLQDRHRTNILQDGIREAAVATHEDPVASAKILQETATKALSYPDPDDGHMHLRDRVLTLDGLLDLPSVEPLVDGLIYRNVLVQLSGPPGCYKSFLAVAVACSAATGMDLGPFEVPQLRTVVYAVAEGANGMGARILAWCEVNKVKPEELFERLHIVPCPIQLGDVVDVSEAAELVRELNADVLVLDTRARCTVGLDENSATEQGKAIEAAESIRRANSCTVWGIHHSPREGNAGRGSNAWDGAVWSDLRMKKEGLQATVHCEKHKDVPDGCDHQFLFVPHTVSPELMPDVKEKYRRTLVLSRNGFWTDTLLANSRQVVLDIVRTKAPREGLTGSEIVEFAKEHGLSRSTTYEALKELLEQGRFQDVGTKSKTRYVATEQDS
jgi:hypothetical protein